MQGKQVFKEEVWISDSIESLRSIAQLRVSSKVVPRLVRDTC